MFRFLMRIAPRTKKYQRANAQNIRAIPHREFTGNAEDLNQINGMVSAPSSFKG
jgi:hypothetical protein